MNCLRSLGHSDVGFESHSRHRCLCAFILCLYCSVCRYPPCDGHIPRPRSPIVCVKMITEVNKRPGPCLGWKRHWEKRIHTAVCERSSLSSWLSNKLAVILELHQEHKVDTQTSDIPTMRHAHVSVCDYP
jgi:hypothetical protein